MAVHGFRRTARAAASCCAPTTIERGILADARRAARRVRDARGRPGRRPARAHRRHRPGRRAPRRPCAGPAASRTRTPTTTRRPTSSDASPSARCARRSWPTRGSCSTGSPARADDDKVVVSDDEARAWLGTLNDLRLTLGSRLGIDEDSHDVLRRAARGPPCLRGVPRLRLAHVPAGDPRAGPDRARVRAATGRRPPGLNPVVGPGGARTTGTG